MTVHNFSAGPSALFPEVIDKIREDLGNWNNTGVSVMEISHRSPEFMAFYRKMLADFYQIMEVPDNYTVLFLQGGGRLQFAAIPLNIEQKFGQALYLNSGHWSRTASVEAAKYTKVKSIELVTNNKLVKTDWTEESKNMDYVHYCPNETVDGVEIFSYLNVDKDTPIVADFSSSILSRPIDVSKFGVIYAGAQKNIGASGVTVVIVRNDLLNKASPTCPDTIDWTVQSKTDSMINTPATFSWYTCGLTFGHLINKFQNLKNIEEYNNKKASLLYQYLDSQDFYKNKVDKDIRSNMNITFYCPSKEIDEIFVKEASDAGIRAIKGHKIVGGLRASLYNSVSLESVEALIQFMEKFKNKYKEEN